MLEKTVRGACGGGDERRNGARVSNLPKSRGSLASCGGHIASHHSHEPVNGVAVPRHPERAGGRDAYAEIRVLESGANRSQSLRRADAV